MSTDQGNDPNNLNIPAAWSEIAAIVKRCDQPYALAPRKVIEELRRVTSKIREETSVLPDRSKGLVHSGLTFIESILSLMDGKKMTHMPPPRFTPPIPPSDSPPDQPANRTVSNN